MAKKTEEAKGVEVEVETKGVEVTETVSKRAKKLSKTVNYNNSTITIEALGGKNGAVTYAFTDLPETIQAKFGPFGLSHKLGDAAAGKTGIEAEEAVLKVFEGLKNGEWSVRAPAKPKVSVNKILDNYKNLDPLQQKAAAKLLEDLGITLPA